MNIRFKAYHSDDEAKVLALFDSNQPDYFAPIERQPFIDFLRSSKKEVYEVMYEREQLIGAGGYCTQNPKEARIVWLMIHRSKHGKGLGKMMMQYFAQKIKKDAKFENISLMTSQLTDAFYAKLGFVTTREENDYWFKGMHLRYMEKKLK